MGKEDLWESRGMIVTRNLNSFKFLLTFSEKSYEWRRIKKSYR